MSGEAQAAQGDHQWCLEGWLPDSGLGLCQGIRDLQIGLGLGARETADRTPGRPASLLPLSF